MNNKITIGLIVSNHFGVLNRIAGLYNKRGYNIDSLAVGATEDPTLSRMTIVSSGDEYTKTQMVRQLGKLYDVKSAEVIDNDNAVFVEHLLIKLKTGTVKNSEINALVNRYGGKILDIGADFVLADITGSPDAVGAFIERCKSIGIHELCRSGELALSTVSRHIEYDIQHNFSSVLKA
ncbi:acetolactate synthase small subunit [Clostridia bacterium]|nr:acetolactate synthase small subunit [Clostridia bacterium]